MKQFQKVGLAAAVATVAAGTVAQPDSAVSRTETGDLAIIPYYTVLDGTNTGMHIINTTDSTQVVKVRLRRGTDSKDALDFNLVMSPRDEWTANIGPGESDSSPVLVTTNDTTCTVPAFPEGGAPMPSTYAEGATEGYVEIIAMAETATELEPIAVAAKHAAGVPADCAAVRQNFYRVAAASVGNAAVRGTHTSNLTSNAACASAGASTACGATGATNLSNFVDSDDNALKVSFMLTDPAGGLEAGDNAVMVEGFADAAMMTNQQPLSFGTDGLLNFDPLNFELPNLAYGAFASPNATRQAAGAAAGDDMTDGSMWTSLADAIDADSVSNDWAAFSTADGTVHADWVVTLPGQYVMTNPICDTYSNYSEANASAAAVCSNATAIAAYSAAGGADRNQLPLIVATNVDGGELVEGSNMNLWDREELSLAGKESTKTPEDPDLGFSPGGSSGDPADPDITVVLPNEVNVIAFGDADGATAVMSNLKLSVTPPETSDRGWGRLDIQSSNATPALWNVTGTDDDNIEPGATLDPGTWTATEPTDVGVVGFAIWQRSFAAQAGNYGRMIEHSTITSTSTSR